jgi:monovalent cation:H+ antiporter-2, CPA2 family
MDAPVVSPTDYKDLVLFLATAGIAVPLFRRLKVSPILGFLGAGVALGPFGLGSLAGQIPWLSYFTVDHPVQISQLAEFGVVFLLFMVGLELSWERLLLLRRMVFGLGLAQLVVCGTLLAFGAAVLLKASVVAAAALGAALALSSTAIIMPLLAERKRLHTEVGRATFSVLLLQDLAVAPILVTLAVLHSGGQVLSPSLLLSLLPAAAGVFLIVVAGRLVLRPMMKSVARARSEELFMAASLLIVVSAGLLASLSGLSMAMGAFIAGLLLAETEYRHQVEVTIQPFRGLLLGLFFVSVGIGLDLSLLARQPVLVLTIAGGVLAIKFVAIFGLARLFRVSTSASLESALALAAGGEFAFVILGEAATGGVVPRRLVEPVLVAVTLSMFLLPIMVALGTYLTRPMARAAAAPEPPPADPDPRVLVVGFGRVGRLVADMLTRHEIPWRAVDRDPRLVDGRRFKGEQVFFGDGARPEFLKRCGLQNAPALVVTMDSPEAVEAVVATARSLRPDLTIVARARDQRQAKRLYELGVTDAVPETIEASLQLSEALLVGLRVPMGLIIASVHEKRDEFRKALNRPEALGARMRTARDRLAQGD